MNSEFQEKFSKTKQLLYVQILLGASLIMGNKPVRSNGVKRKRKNGRLATCPHEVGEEQSACVSLLVTCGELSTPSSVVH